ncbi:hypothetical protein AcW1_004007 [Taiwanofungus camphoratus]|nr:hypothetical protein AcV5_003699 [Antrodia cinnamomea]KAI0959069.1 hypothetical protein AcW1_004007 [Antrodia cinnamomea]
MLRKLTCAGIHKTPDATSTRRSRTSSLLISIAVQGPRMRSLALLPLLCSIIVGALAEESLKVSFRPRDLPKKVATCKAINRATDKVKDIEIHYADVNPEAERAILMVHGWPSLWHSWKFQIDEFKDDYHLMVPDLRGFGSSTHPGDVKASGNWADIVGDLACVLEHARVQSVVCMGHDWGTQLCYQAARQRPDLIKAVVGSAIPYIPFSGPFHPTSALVPAFPSLSYQIFLGETPDLAAAELNADIRRTLRGTLRSISSPTADGFLRDKASFLNAWKAIDEIAPIPFFTQEEEDYWVEQYSIQGFKNTFQFYTPENQRGSWDFIHAQGNLTIPQPVLSILPKYDPVADWVEAAKLMGSAQYLPSLTTEVIYGAHWLQLENPKEFNEISRKWLDELASEGQEKAKGGVHGRPADEL